MMSLKRENNTSQKRIQVIAASIARLEKALGVKPKKQAHASGNQTLINQPSGLDGGHPVSQSQKRLLIINESKNAMSHEFNDMTP
ncbi:hypothetical protein FGO68_gene11405 [Halteria grandinella]|uniref:Uncharacterized protein n=1 Tax=Halteria grandinella TaxID=5974 RepID=A0A8J8T1K7_HALGN|nr:hypothetical protein FGO68_gene11405 [Halteria grandinella]